MQIKSTLILILIINVFQMSYAQGEHGKKLFNGSQHDYNRMGYAGSLTLDVGRNFQKFSHYDTINNDLTEQRINLHSHDMAGELKGSLFKPKYQGTDRKFYFGDYYETGIGFGKAVLNLTVNYGLVATKQITEGTTVGLDLGLWGFNAIITADESIGINNILIPKVMAQYQSLYLSLRGFPAVRGKENNPNKPGYKAYRSRLGAEIRWQLPSENLNRGWYFFASYDQETNFETLPKKDITNFKNTEATIRIGVALLR